MKAKKGDKIIIIADGSYRTSYNKGEIWDVFNEGSECVYACKNGDEKNYTLFSDHEYEIYKQPALLFQIGDVVRIAPSSEHYHEGFPHNPKDVSGKIVEHKDGNYKYRVKWDNGNTNSYRDEDLFHYALDYPCKNGNPAPIKNGDKVICTSDCVNSSEVQEGKVYINKGEILTNVTICDDRVWFNEKPGIGNGNYPIACFEVYTGALSSTSNPCSEIILNQFKVGDRIIATSNTIWWKKGALGIVVSTDRCGDGSFSFNEIDTFGNVKTRNWTAVYDNKFSLYTGEYVTEPLSIKDGDTIICIKDCTNSDYSSNSAPVFKGEVLTGTVVSSGRNRLWCTEKPGAGKGSYPAECFQVYTGVEPRVQKPHEKIPIKVGDMVEVTKRYSTNEATVGMIGRVIQTDEKSEIKYLIETPNGNSWCLDAKHSSGVPTPKLHNYSVGDIITVTKGAKEKGDIGKIGDVGKFVKSDSSNLPYQIQLKNGVKIWCADIRNASLTEKSMFFERNASLLFSDCLHEPTENLEFQTPIIVKKPNKKRNLVIINN